MITVLAVIGAILLFVAAVFEVLLIAGLPLGEFTMGGRYKILPPMMRVAGAFSLLTQVFAALILLQAAGIMIMWFSVNVTRIICYVFGGFFAFNTIMNFFSLSKKEKYTMTPLALIEGVIFILTAISLK